MNPLKKCLQVEYLDIILKMSKNKNFSLWNSKKTINHFVFYITLPFQDYKTVYNSKEAFCLSIPNSE